MLSDISMKDRPELQLTIDEAESLLGSEYVLIPPPPQAAEDSSEKIKRTSTVLIETYYITNLRYEDIRKYYDSKLKEYGWQFIKEKKIKEWGDYAGIAVIFSKGEIYAIINYYGNNSNYGRTYDFNMSWGIPAEAL